MNGLEPVLITCPDTGERLVPSKVWKSQLPNGQSVLYAQFRLHHHRGQECAWSYMIVAVPQK